ncbi:nucleoside triphosphate pyrophosphohydrolase [Thermaurantiacus sp.]
MGGATADIGALVAIMARLRDRETGCPWDLAQDFASIAPYTIEEAHEVADAIDRGDWKELKEELGDLLLQVVFHARMAEEAGHFTLAEVVDGIVSKLVRRHPHVFGNAEASDADGVRLQWEEIKAREKPRASALDGVAKALPALMRAQKISERAARKGFDWADAQGARTKILEELAELDEAVDRELDADLRLDVAGSGLGACHAEEAGDLLFATVNYLRKLGIDAESALRLATAKFERRFRAIEAAPGFEALPLEDKERLWVEAKRQEASSQSRA